MKFLSTLSRGSWKEATLKYYGSIRLMMIKAPHNSLWTLTIRPRKNLHPISSKPKAPWEVHTVPTTLLRNWMLSASTDKENPTHSSAKYSKSLKKISSAGAKTESIERKVQAGRLEINWWKKKLSNGSENNIFMAGQSPEKTSVILQWNTVQRNNSNRPKDGSKILWEDTKIWLSMLKFDRIIDSVKRIYF